jgi:hypothetical protein
MVDTRMQHFGEELRAFTQTKRRNIRKLQEIKENHEKKDMNVTKRNEVTKK